MRNDNENDNGIRRKSTHLWMLLMCLLFAVTGCGNTMVEPEITEEAEAVVETDLFAMVCRVDEVNQKITLRSVTYDTEVILNYTGGVDVRDKFGDIMSIKQVTPGSIVDVVYDADRNKLLSLYLSGTEKVQKLEHVSGVLVDNVKGTVQVNGTTYQMSQSISAFSNRSEIGINEICSEDQVTVWLYNDLVCSMYVELGHGYVRLSDYASYIGGMVEIGYDVIVPVTEDMLLTVREGVYTLRIAKNADVGTKKVEVIKDQEVNISLADLAIEPKQMGSVLFRVTPAEAVVCIDGRKVNTEGAVDLVYGKHRIDITADGYDSYSASFNVNYAYKIKDYALSQSASTPKESPADSTAGTRSDMKTKNTTETATEVAENTTEENAAKQNTTGENAADEKTSQTSDTKDVTAVDENKTDNKVTVTAPIGVNVYFDGEYLGIAPISFTKVTGSHIITLSLSGCLSKSYAVTFSDDGKDSELQYDELISISGLLDD